MSRGQIASCVIDYAPCHNELNEIDRWRAFRKAPCALSYNAKKYKPHQCQHRRFHSPHTPADNPHIDNFHSSNSDTLPL